VASIEVKLAQMGASFPQTMKKNHHFLYYIQIVLIYHKINLEINIFDIRAIEKSVSGLFR
jgi:hypothetical protein